MNSSHRNSQFILPKWIACVCILAAYAPLQAQRIKVQVQGGQVQRAFPFATQGSGSLLIPGPPRELRRAIQEAERSIGDNQYSEAIESLQEILDSPDAEDFFLPHEKGQTWDSIKRKAQRMIGEMPAAGREAYELKVGSDARRLLTSGLQQNDIAAVMDVSRRFFHTSFGYDATMLVARYELDHGHPMSAANSLQRLLNIPMAASKFGVEVPLMLAVCHQLSGNVLSVEKVVEDNYQELASAAITISGNEKRLPQDMDQLLTFIKQVAGDRVTLQVGNRSEWHLFRGGPTRDGRSDGGMPMRDAEWELPVALWTGDHMFLNEFHEKRIDDAEAAIPVPQPIVVGEQLLMRTARLIFGVNMKNGKRIWPYPEDRYEEMAPKRAAENNPAAVMPINRMMANPRHQMLKQRIWQDALYSQMSSDGQRLFLLIEPDVDKSKVRRSVPQPFQLNQAMRAKSVNQLVALDVASEGYTLWTAGGSDSVDENLSEVFFLGCPLPLGDELFAIGEIKDEVSLFCIDSTSGMLKWSQQLAQVESQLPISSDSNRRMSGATPSYANGILVCPTSAGALVAVDLAARTLLWAHVYDESQSLTYDNRRNFRGQFPQQPSKPVGNHWADSAAIIADGYVLFTPSESDKLVCVDLYTGQTAWTPKNRGNMLYIAGVHENTILAVQQNGLRGINLLDGKQAWKTVPLSQREIPTGRGFINEPYYFMPTNQSEIIKFSIEKGEIVERRKTDRVLGNLICHGDHLISQGADGLFAYPIESRRRASLSKLVETNRDDPEVLRDYATLLFEDGKTEEALKTMQRAVELTSSAHDKTDIQQMLARMLATAVESDFEKYHHLSSRFFDLSPQSEIRQQFARASIKGLVELGDIDQAMAAFLELVEATVAHRRSDLPSKARSINEQKQWKVGPSVELAVQFSSLIAPGLDGDLTNRTPAGQASPFDEKALARVREHVQSAIDTDDWLTAIAWTEIFQHSQGLEDHPEIQEIAATTFLKVAESKQDKQPLLSASLLHRLDGLSDPQFSFQAALKATQTNARQGHYRLAADGFNALVANRKAMQFEDKTASDWQSEFLKQLENDEINLQTKAWPDGAVKIEAGTESKTRKAERNAWQPVIVRSMSSTSFENYELYVDSFRGNLFLVDEYGTVKKSVSIGKVDRRMSPVRAREFNRIIVLELQAEIVAVDLFSAEKDDSERVLWRVALDTPTSRKQIGTDAFFGTKHLARSTVLGNVSANGVCILRGADLECRDLRTGEVQWMQRSVGGDGTILFGDEQYVCLSRTRDASVDIYDIRNGTKIKTANMPLRTKQIDTVGRFILHYDGKYNSGTDLKFMATDPMTGKAVWEFESAGTSKACYVNANEIALVEPNGLLRIFDSRTGELKLDAVVMPEKRLQNIYVNKMRDRYIVITSTSSQRTSRVVVDGIETRVRLQTVHNATIKSAVTGRIYAFDRKSWRMMWQDPISVDRFNIHGQAYSNPFLVMTRNVIVSRREMTKPVQNPVRRTQSKNESSFAILDTRRGEFMLIQESLPRSMMLVDSVVEPEKTTVTFAFSPKKTYTLTMTDEEQTSTPLQSRKSLGPPAASQP